MSLAAQQQLASLEHISQIAQRLDGKLGKDVYIYSISIDPESDTTEKLAAYAKEHAVPVGWHLLLPANDDHKQITDRFGKHLSSHHHHAGVNQRMVHYGNGGVGLWSAFAIEAAPDMAVKRLSWVQNGQNTDNKVKRAGPPKLESLNV